MTVFKCSICGKEVKPENGNRRKPYMVFYVNKPCADPGCNGKAELVKA